MNGYFSAMAFTALLRLQLLIFHPIISHMKLVTRNAGHSTDFMETAIPLHPLFFTQVQPMATSTGLTMYLSGFFSPTKADERRKSYAPPGPR
jgi:hypothetical protein